MRLALGMRVDENVAWEILYFGLQNWSAGQTITTNPLTGTVATSPYTQTDKLLGGFDKSLGYTYSSQLQNVEFNARRMFQTGSWTMSPLFGLRYLQWSETFNLNGVDQFYGATENVYSRANNYLLGLQIGGDVRYQWNRLALGLTGKAGIYTNLMRLNQSNLGSSGIANVPGSAGFISIDSSSNPLGAAEHSTSTRLPIIA